MLSLELGYLEVTGKKFELSKGRMPLEQILRKKVCSG